jgi:hypothetical protein
MVVDIIFNMENLFNVFQIGIDQYVNGTDDFGSVLDDPDAYFGTEILDPENLYNAGTTGELPPFQQNVDNFINDPSISTFIGIIPGVGGTYQTAIDAVDNVVDLPTWLTGDNGVEGSIFDNPFQPENTEEEITFTEEPPVITPPPTTDQPVEEDDCCCCC